MTILGPVAINRLAECAQADMTDQATRDNVQRFAYEALPDLIETVRFWMDAWDQLNQLYLDEVHRDLDPLRSQEKIT